MTSNQTGTGEPAPRLPPALARILAVYKGVALMFFNVLVFYLLLNLALGFVKLMMLGKVSTLAGVDPITSYYGGGRLDRVYPGLDRSERERLLREAWNRPVTYDDFTHFKERSTAGKYVNVTDAGYRASANQGPWPLSPDNVNVFVFGGSTMFGYGVSDNETVASYLQEALAAHSKRRVCVYNFGTANHFSTQERIRLEKLLNEKHVPDIAVFVDGINDGLRIDNKPEFSDKMAQSFERVSGGSSFWQQLADVGFWQLPVGSFARYVGGKVHPEPAQRTAEMLLAGCETYFANKYLIEKSCERYGVTPIFVWQPAPGYNYDLKHHLFFTKMESMEYQKVFYDAMQDYLKAHPAGPDFLWCADMQKDRSEPLYCDQFHYTAAFAKDSANAICQMCVERKLLDKVLQR